MEGYYSDSDSADVDSTYNIVKISKPKKRKTPVKKKKCVCLKKKKTGVKTRKPGTVKKRK